MASETSKDITQLLVEYGKGNEEALESLLPQVYQHLHRLAVKYMRRENPNHTLQPTALVNEAFLRLTNGQAVSWQNRAHFFAVSANLMRRILTDHAKAKRAQKRGGKEVRVSFDEKIHWATDDGPDLIALNDALERLSALDERQARVVELRYFGGLSIEETAEVLQSSPATVKRDWAMAKLWLYREMKSDDAA
jgi:RNA polymerase sigma factor (TIGR02999 family)